MKNWKLALAQGALAGSLASILSTVVLALAGRRETGSAVAPINAVSHWYWNDEALHQRQLDLAHTGLGYLTHHGSAIFWATLYAALCSNKPASRSLGGIVGGAIATSATACAVDYKLVPKRLTPGFEHHLSTPAMVEVFATLALGLAAGALAMRDRYHDETPEAEDAVSPEPELRIVRRRRAGSTERSRAAG